MSFNSPMNYTEAVTCVLDGITLANETYNKWCGRWMGWDGVEGLLVAKIGERLHDRSMANGVDDETITLETSMGEVGKKSGSTARKRPEYIEEVLSDSNRLDITLWNNQEKPQGVFEIKRYWNSTGCPKDLLRVAAMVHEHGHLNGGSIEWGFAAFFVDSETTKKDDSLDYYTTKYENQIRDEFERYKISEDIDLTFNYGPVMYSEREEETKKGTQERTWEGQGVCMAVKPKKKRRG